MCYEVPAVCAPPAEGAMRVELVIDGGLAYIPGLAKPIVIEGAQLAAGDLAEMRRLCREALAGPILGARTRPASLPDARRYRLTLEIDGEKHEVTAADPVSQPAIAELIDFLREHGSP
jgi:hypothetical protein